MNDKLFSYNNLNTPIHNMSGLTKFICFLLLTSAVMFSYDIRVILLVMIFSLFLLKISKIKFSQIKVMLIYVSAFLLANAIITYFFSPEQGVKIYGTKHELVHLFGRYTITSEQLFYQVTKLFKYSSVIPLGILFLLTTNPSEFASSLNGVGINYKAAFAVSLTLRYFPDIMRNYNDISLAQQARGLDMSKKAKLTTRFKNAILILMPLIFSSLDRVEHISNAMDLRGFGKHKKRTWYASKKLTKLDYMALIISAAIFILILMVSIFINKSRFYNPFV